MHTDEARLLSRILFEARERVDMMADIVETNTGQPDLHGRRLMKEIDDYRAKQGWNPHGFGKEIGAPQGLPVVCPEDEHRAQNTCHECTGSGVVPDIDGDVTCITCRGFGHFHADEATVAVRLRRMLEVLSVGIAIETVAGNDRSAVCMAAIQRDLWRAFFPEEPLPELSDV